MEVVSRIREWNTVGRFVYGYGIKCLSEMQTVGINFIYIP